MTTSEMVACDPVPSGGVQLSGLDLLGAFSRGAVAAPPFCETMDIWPVEIEFGRVVFEGTPSRRFYNPMGLVHGGWIAALLDTAMGSAVHSTLELGQRYATIEMKTVMVKPVFEDSGALRCEGVTVHHGKRIAHAEGKVHDATGILVAFGSESCMIMGSNTDNRPRRGA